MTDISIITTCHDIGRLFHATTRSILLAAEECRNNGLSVEWIIVQDHADKSTQEYVRRHTPEDAIVIELEVGDLGQARNAGVDAAHGHFIAHIDSDDLWSPNWLTAAFAFANSLPTDQVVLHAPVLLFFEGKEHFWMFTDSESADFCPSTLFTHNCWAVSSFAPRDVYVRFPYTTTDLAGGFGYEDWHFNCETIAAGIAHKLVPDTFHCYRVKSWKSSLYDHSSRQLCIMKPSRLFDLAYQKMPVNNRY